MFVGRVQPSDAGDLFNCLLFKSPIVHSLMALAGWSIEVEVKLHGKFAEFQLRP